MTREQAALFPGSKPPQIDRLWISSLITWILIDKLVARIKFAGNVPGVLSAQAMKIARRSCILPGRQFRQQFRSRCEESGSRATSLGQLSITPSRSCDDLPPVLSPA